MNMFTFFCRQKVYDDSETLIEEIKRVLNKPGVHTIKYKDNVDVLSCCIDESIPVGLLDYDGRDDNFLYTFQPKLEIDGNCVLYNVPEHMVKTSPLNTVVLLEAE